MANPLHLGWKVAIINNNTRKGHAVSPTVFRYKNYRFFFFSKEEARMHIHIMSPKGDAKFWIEPVIAC